VSNGDSLIGIIGAGAMGKAVARHAVRVGIDIVVCNRRGPEALAPFLAEMGPRARAGRLADVVKPEIVIVAVPWSQVAGVLAQVAHWESRILVDATNPIFPPDMRPEEMPGTTSSEIVERLAPGAQVVKAFNSLPAALLEANPETAGGRRVLFLAGNHRRAKITTERLIAKMGFAPIDLGTLAFGGALIQTPGGPLAGLNLLQPQ
jgi:predicted dinucleotide-binding enzyme